METKMTIYDFKTEYQANPKGLSVKIPGFSWKISSRSQDTVQKRYQIVVSSGEKTVWDSGRVLSSQSVLVPYGGEALEEEKHYRVCVAVEDNHGNRAETEAFFDTGIWDTERLTAKMITHDFPEEETACPIFYQDFSVEKEVAGAYLYVTAHGVYEAYLNGERIGDAYMAPGWTSYHKRLQYQYYDVTAQIAGGEGQAATEETRQESRENLQAAGKNRLELWVGNGWYKGILSYDCKPNRYGDRVEALAELHILYKDGTRKTVATDENWRVRTGEIRYSEIYMGETQDTWKPEIREGKVRAVPFDRAVLVPQESEPVRVTERLSAKKVWKDPDGNWLADFGQNLTGLVELAIQGEPGQQVRIRHAELLDREGRFYPDTLRTAKSHDNYVLNGKPQILMPHFTFHGFRYIAVDGIVEPKPEMFTACVMHSDMSRTGSFTCSNELVNRLQENVSWSMRDNFFDIPTDCPQRDERLGWMGDAQVFAKTAAFNRNAALFFRKWMRDVAAESSLEEGVPHVVPDIQGTKSSAAWSDAAVIIPWTVYQAYGDVRILEESWKCMHEWIDYIQARTNENGLWMTNYQYGDWLALDREAGESSVGATDVYFVANACYLYVTDLVTRTAGVLGKKEEEEKYRALYDRTLESFRTEYFTARGRIVSETQTACALSLCLNLAREADRETILKTLVTNIENHKNHLTTGFVGTPWLCHALSENGAHETAVTLFMKEDCPSWLYQVKMGATTMWENWNGIKPDGTMLHPGLNSMNHYAYGAIGDWMYRKIGGINPLEPGYRKFCVKPMLVRGIEDSRTSLESPYGEIVSEVSCRDGKITIKIKVPANTTAVICLPEREEAIEAGSGEYVYEYGTETSLKELRFTLDSTLGDILDAPEGRRLMEEMAPELMANPMIEYARRMTLAEGISAAPEIRAVYEAVLKALNA